MGKGEKLLTQWAGNPPKEARINDVKTFLNTFFPDMWRQKKSSHIVVRCKWLENHPDYHPYGEISVPVKGGQQVKGFYVKRLVEAVQLLMESGDKL